MMMHQSNLDDDDEDVYLTQHGIQHEFVKQIFERVQGPRADHHHFMFDAEMDPNRNLKYETLKFNKGDDIVANVLIPVSKQQVATRGIMMDFLITQKQSELFVSGFLASLLGEGSDGQDAFHDIIRGRSYEELRQSNQRVVRWMS